MKVEDQDSPLAKKLSELPFVDATRQDYGAGSYGGFNVYPLLVKG